MITTISAGIIIDKTKAYLRMIRIISFVTNVLLLNSLWVLPLGNFYITLCIIGIAGSMLSILPVAFSFSVYLTHPVPPAVSNGLIMSGSQTFALVFSLCGGKLFLTSFYLGMSLFCGMALTTLIVTLCMS